MNRRRAGLHLYSGKASRSTRKKDPETPESRRSHPQRRDCGVDGTGHAFVRNIRRIVRSGVGGKGKADAGEEFCKRLLAASSVEEALTLSIYRRLVATGKKKCTDLTSQLLRAASSVGASIAKGCGRRSDPEMRCFLQIARGSANELECHLLLARTRSFCRQMTSRI